MYQDNSILLKYEICKILTIKLVTLYVLLILNSIIQNSEVSSSDSQYSDIHFLFLSLFSFRFCGPQWTCSGYIPV